MTSFRQAIADATELLSRVGLDQPRREAKLLLEHASGLDATKLLNNYDENLPGACASIFDDSVKRRAEGEPFAYITGVREFWSLPFEVTPATLIPRPDTETLIEMALEFFPDHAPERVLDIGTGSGCILAALLTEWSEAHGVGTDTSDAALAVAARNVTSLGLNDRVFFAPGSWAGDVAGEFDLVVSNPPYIRSGDIAGLDLSVRAFEPISALDGGEDGLDAYRSLIPEAVDKLSENGFLALEIGAGQAADVIAIAGDAGLDLTAMRDDLSGIRRAIGFHKKSVGITGGSR